MAATSNLGWPALPEELERQIFLLGRREPHELAKYIRVAHRVKTWIQPILYRKINILSEITAERLISSLSRKPKRVLYLYLGMSISPSTAARVLRLCPRLINLVLCAGGNSLSKYSVVLSTINGLSCLKFLSIDPAVLFQTCFAYLPNVSVFHRISHLDVISHWTWETITRGYHYLYHLTHLSMTLKQSRGAAEALRGLLRRPGFKVLVIWRDEVEGESYVIANLVKRQLDDPRIVILRRAGQWSLRLDGGFWLHAERVIAWRKERNITTVGRPLYLEDLANKYPEIDLAMFPWERN